MSQINQKSISGITSITTPAGVDNQLTVHTNDTTERLKVTSSGINVTGVVTANSFEGDGSSLSGITTVDVSIQGGGGGSGAGFSTSNAGLHTTSSIGVNTSALASTLTGVGNSFQGIYVSNGMMIMDNTLNGNHYIGTTYNGLMAGPVNIEGTLSIDGNYVVV